MFRLFYTDVSLHDDTPTPNLSGLIPLSFNTFELALESAFRIQKMKGIVWQIDGPNNFSVDRGHVESLYQQRFGRRVGA